MGTSTYQEVMDRIQRLTVDDLRKLLEELTALVRQQEAAQPLHSILELEGLGEEIWRGIDAQKYVDEERNSWDG